MNLFVKLLCFVLCGCMAGLYLRGTAFHTPAALCGLALGGVLIVQLLEPVYALIRELTAAAGVGTAVFGPVLKAAAIGILTQTAGGFCADAGEQALGKLLELGGVCAILYVSVPLYSAVLELLRTLMEGA